MKNFISHLSEKITASTPTGEVIRDFIKSKAPQFKGKSKKERIRMALGAKYAMMRSESYKFDTTRNQKGKTHHELDIRMTQPDGRSVDVELHRKHDAAEGQWHLETIKRSRGQSKGSHWSTHENAGSFGVGPLRALIRHLKDTHGVTSLTGQRITGARRKLSSAKQSVSVPLTREEVNFIHSMIAEGKVKKQNKTMKNWVIKTAMTQGMSPRPRGSEATRIARKKYSEMKENRIFISLSEAGPVKRENKAKAREYMRGLGTTLRYRLKKTPYNPHGDMGPHTKWMHDDNAEGDVRRGRGVHKSNMAARTTDRLTNAIYHRTHSRENAIKMDWAERKARLDSYGRNQNERTKKVAFDNLPSHLKKIGSVSMYGSRFTGYKKQTEE